MRFANEKTVRVDDEGPVQRSLPGAFKKPALSIKGLSRAVGIGEVFTLLIQDTRADRSGEMESSRMAIIRDIG